jgi:hypothetical protein
MIRYLVIAGRDHADLYGFLRRQFAGDDTVQVLLDRRYLERRRGAAPTARERRRGERRRGRGRESDLATHGLLIVRQVAGLQWRPPWWGAGPPPAPGAEAPAGAARARVTGWLTEGQRLLGVVPKLLQEHEALTARAAAAERKGGRLEEEVRRLRSETEHFRRERRQLVETLKALTRSLIESAGAPEEPGE